MIAVDETTKSQIDRILQSHVMRSSDALKRLLSFLAEKSLAGEADDLKEYSIGVDAFGKPSTYDPRQDSSIRIHAARLRQKLADYYRTEGKDDAIVVDLPKGQFKLTWHSRSAEAAGSSTKPSNDARSAGVRLRSYLAVACAGLVATTAWAVYSTIRLGEERQSSALYHSQWTPEIAALWEPFVGSERPLLISIGTPLFVNLPGLGIFRDTSLNNPEAISQSKALATITQALHITRFELSSGYASLGAAHAAFTIGKLLGARKANISTVNGNELSWRQLSENNVVLIGRQRFFRLQLAGLPVKPELDLEEDVGVRNLNPAPGEPSIFTNTGSPATGVTYALVSLMPGPEGNSSVMDFFARDGAAMTGALSWFVDPASAKSLVAKLRGRTGQVPRYYQVLLKVRSQDRVPLETSYVLHRELRPVGR